MITKTRSPLTLFCSKNQYTVTKLGTGTDNDYPYGGTAGFGSFLTPAPAYTGSFQDLNESITYGVNRPINYCSHTITKRDNLREVVTDTIEYHISVTAWKARVVRYNEENYAIQYGLNGHSSHFTTAFNSYSTANWESNSGLALRAMWPGVEEAVSVPTSLGEIREVIHLPKQFARNVKRVYELVPRLLSGTGGKGGPIARNRLAPLKLLLKRGSRTIGALSDSVLMNEFGIKPLVNDVLALRNAVKTAAAAAKRLLDEQDVAKKRHFRKWLDQPANQYLVYGGAGTWNDVRIFRNQELSESWYTATLSYKYRLPSQDLEELKRLVLLDQLGLNFNPRAVWDLLPWSFVVDWVAKVGDWIDGYAVKALQPIVQIDGFCHSIKVKSRKELYIERNYNHTLWAPKVKALIGGETTSTYIRKESIPNFYSELQLSGLSSREIKLAGALAGSKQQKLR